MYSLPWTIALTAALTLLGATASLWAWKWRKPRRMIVLPTEWALTARPVFSAQERKLHRLLREALPNHVVLSKLPLVRFCQPTEPNDVRYWFDLLGASHVTFAVCSTNGRVLAAFDVETDQGESSRVTKIKQSVLTACHVPYRRCAIDQPPSTAELQLLVSGLDIGPRPAQLAAATTLGASHRLGVRASDPDLPHPAALWHESAMQWDSFFAPDTHTDSFGNSKFPAVDGVAAERTARPCANPPAPVHADLAPESRHPSGDYDDIVIGAPRFSASARL